MHDRDGTLTDERVSYRYTSPSGMTVEVLNVPARVFANGQTREIVYSRSVASRLQEITKALIASNTGKRHVTVDFSDDFSYPQFDFSFSFSGPDARLNSASIKTWRLIFDRSYNAIKLAMQAIPLHSKTPTYPTVKFLAPSSIKIAVETDPNSHLYPFDEKIQSDSTKGLRLLFDTGIWLDAIHDELANKDMPPALRNDLHMLDTLLRAVEELSPGNDDLKVNYYYAAAKSSTIFDQQKGLRARDMRVKLRMEEPDFSKQIELMGVIHQLDIGGKVTLRRIKRTEDWRRSQGKFTFEPTLLTALLENFGQNVSATVVLRKSETGIVNVEIVDIRRVADF